MARPKSPVQVASGRFGLAVRLGDEAQIATLRGDLAVARISAYVQRELADTPPLNDQQKADLRSIVDEAVA